MRGVDVYRKEDIPDDYFYKNARYVQEILVVCKPGKNLKIWKYLFTLSNCYIFHVSLQKSIRTNSSIILNCVIL